MLPTTTLTIDGLAAVPHLDQYFGAWAMLPQNLNAMAQWAMGLNIDLHLASPQAAAARSAGSAVSLTVDRGVAIIGLAGTLMKQQASYGSSSSTVLARRKIR